MGGGVTTGSLLNQRVFNRNGGSGSSNGGGGVKRSALLQTKITLADRNKGSGRTSYTALSNRFNGRNTVVYVGGGSSCSGTSSLQKMQELQAKIQMYSMIAESGMNLIDSIGSLFGAGKSDKTGGAAPKTKVPTVPTDITNPAQNSKVAGNDLAATLDSLGFTDIDFTNIDYKATANDFISKMKKADTSQDLYQALQGAKAYKEQMELRMSGIDINALKTELSTLEGEAEGSVDFAEDALGKADDGVKDADRNVRQAKGQVESARNSYDSARAGIKTSNEAYNNADKAVGEKTQAYDKAAKALDGAREDYRLAQDATRECTQAWDMAKSNTAQALANLNALKAQQGFDTDGAALQAQIADAQLKYDEAVAAENKAKEAKDSAEAAEAKAKEALGDGSKGAVQAFNNAKSELSAARGDLAKAAETLKNSKEITQDQYDLLINRQTSAENAESNLEAKNEALATAKDQQAVAQDKLDEVKAQKEKLETQIHDYEEMQDACEKLGDLSKYETKLEKLMTEEGTDRTKLTQKLNDKDGVSNDDEVSAKGRKKAERKEEKLTDELTALNAGDATDDIARDLNIQVTNALDNMANMGNFDLGTGIPNKRTINGHTVEYKNGQYFVDNGTLGMNRMSAEMMLKTKAFGPLPKAPFGV